MLAFGHSIYIYVDRAKSFKMFLILVGAAHIWAYNTDKSTKFILTAENICVWIYDVNGIQFPFCNSNVDSFRVHIESP